VLEHSTSFPNENIPQLSESESKLLQEGLDSNDLPKQDVLVAHMRATHILHKWRQDILTAVREGEHYDEYSNTLLPSPKNESEVLAMRLVHFRKIEANCLSPENITKTKEEKAAELTRQIVLSTKVTEPVKVTYLSSSDSESNGESSTTTTKCKVNGTAVKMNTNKWQVTLESKTSMEATIMAATDTDLMNANMFHVRQLSSDDNDDNKKKKQSAKQKRARKAEQVEREKRIREKGIEKLRELENKEYRNLCEKFQSGNEYPFKEFLEMIDRMRKPFVCQIEGHEVSLAQDDCAIMMETSAVWAITIPVYWTR